MTTEHEHDPRRLIAVEGDGNIVFRRARRYQARAAIYFGPHASDAGLELTVDPSGAWALRRIPAMYGAGSDDDRTIVAEGAGPVAPSATVAGSAPDSCTSCGRPYAGWPEGSPYGKCEDCPG